ncbi:MAG TPA: cytidine deaminase [Treponemataceae bacterium]|nr:cytidine deaminase [Treponemataceae bacterium]
MENTIDYSELFAIALKAAQGAYAPYSQFRVGAALLLDDGSIVTGVNVENRSFGLTNCAERSAVYTAVTAGKTHFSAIVIATPDSNYPVSPCGACRQVLSEFMNAHTPVVFGSSFSNSVQTTLGELFPFDALHELADKDHSTSV